MWDEYTGGTAVFATVSPAVSGTGKGSVTFTGTKDPTGDRWLDRALVTFDGYLSKQMDKTAPCYGPWTPGTWTAS